MSWADGGGVTLSSEFAPIRVRLDPRTALPTAITDGESVLTAGCVGTLEVGGSEVTPPTGGLEYQGVTSYVIDHGSEPQVVSGLDVDSRSFAIARSAGDWTVIVHYVFRSDQPRLSIALEAVPPATRVRILRNARLSVDVRVDDPTSWRLHAPGNRVRPGLVLADLTRSLAVSPPAGLKGSSGLVALEDVASGHLALFWPFPTSEIGDVHVSPANGAVRLDVQLDLAGEPAAGSSLRSGPVYLDWIAGTWAETLADVPGQLGRLGVIAPHDSPEWIRAATIFEVHIGDAVFSGGWTYGPYPSVRHVLDDLDRIAALGFDAIQVMPRHPYPSYNVHDYADVSTSWGDAAELRQLVDACHARGMHVILDLLLHGVVDREMVGAVADAIRSGPYLARMDVESAPLWAADDESRRVSWSRHILDFEPYWLAGSPPRHPLADEHPDWFCRTSDGRIVGIYTKAFDSANPGWQRFVIDSCLDLVRELDIDGFRLDAPTYNYFANWSPRAREHASASMVGCIPLFRRLRSELRRLKPQVVLYTEPSGALWRQSMDVCYDYDEQWLFGIVSPYGAPAGDQEHVTARDLGRWLQERDAALPIGSMTVHHIDSHDTFWWPLPNAKWMREQVGVPATTALMTVFALSGGPFMMFVGGETGVEDRLRSVLSLRRAHAELAVGVSDYDAFQQPNDDVYAVVRRGDETETLVLVNLSSVEVTASGRFSRPVALDGAKDVLGDTARIEIARSRGRGGIRFRLPAYGAAVVPLRA